LLIIIWSDFMIVGFVSPDAVKTAFLEGVEKYQSYYKIQSNYGDNKKLYKKLDPNDHSISSDAISTSLEWKRLMESADGENNITQVIHTFLDYQGVYEKLGITKFKNNSNIFEKPNGFLTKKKNVSSNCLGSLSTFIYVAILNQATIFSGFIKRHDYMLVAAKVDTGYKPYEGIDALIAKFLQQKQLQNKKIYLDDDQGVSLSAIPESERVLAGIVYLLSKTPEGGRVLGNILSRDKLNKYIKLGNQSAPVDNNQGLALPDKIIQNYGMFNKQILQGIGEYVAKFNHRVDSGTPGWNKDNIKQLLSPLESIPIVGDPLGKYYDYVLSGLLDKKSYGFMQVHGVTGQIRAFLFANACKNFSIHVNKTQEYLTYSKKVREHSNYGLDVAESLHKDISEFKLAYAKSLKIMPNKSGSLGTMLRIYADPQTDLIYGDAPSTNMKALGEFTSDRLHNKYYIK
ncbi:hypothetical protein OAO18_09280, partial [Francisellaceae bacterium]|nr:hypothetical protein [Francisellaceae bacterium]